MGIKDNKYYKEWIKGAWPYLTGAILLSVFQIVTLATTGNPWGVSGVLANWGAWLFEAVGGNVDKWYYFSSEGAQRTLDGGLLNHSGSIRNIGIIFGALLAVLLAGGLQRLPVSLTLTFLAFTFLIGFFLVFFLVIVFFLIIFFWFFSLN